MKSLFSKTIDCYMCNTTFKTSKVKKRKQIPIQTDSDFCTYYSEENPIYYLVNVCPNCGYSFTESFKKPKKDLREDLPPLPEEDYSGVRDETLALEAYRRAIQCAKVQKSNSEVLAGLYLHMSWVYRIGGYQDEELWAMQQALDYYEDAFWHSDTGNYDMILYLLGELNRRLGNLNEALFYFQRVATDRSVSNPNLIRKAREMWQHLREENQST